MTRQSVIFIGGDRRKVKVGRDRGKRSPFALRAALPLGSGQRWRTACLVVWWFDHLTTV
jgi:hypothetical protein